MLKIGTDTKYGRVAGVRTKDGERYYMLLTFDGVVSLMPADVIEAEVQDVER